MRFLLLFTVVGALSALASVRIGRPVNQFFGLALLTASGLVFLVLGAVAGPSALGLLRADELVAVRPLLALGLGTVGLLVGLHFEPSLLRALPVRIYRASFSQAAIALLAVSVPLAAILHYLFGTPEAVAVGAGLTLGAAASVSSAHFAVVWYRAGRLDRARGLGVSILAMLDDGVGLLALALALLFGAAEGVVVGLGLLCLTLLIGLLCGALVAYLMRAVSDGPEVGAVLLGALALVSGAAAYLSVSPLLAGAACGGALALVGGRYGEKLYRTLSRFERPVYLLLLFLIGAHADLTDLRALVLVPTVIALRTAGKVFGGRLAKRLSGGALALPQRPGYALLAQGGLSLCVAVEYLLLVSGAEAQLVFDVIVVTALINELLAARTFGRSLQLGPKPKGAHA